METSVKMQRKLFNGVVRQDSKTGFICLNDLVAAGNSYRLSSHRPLFSLPSWFNSSATKEFVAEIERQFGKCISTTRGKTGGTWAHIFIALDLALAIEPTFKVEVYKWMYDELIKYRNHSGDSYKKMCGALYMYCGNKSKFHKGIATTALMIQDACNVNDWQVATEEQLRLRDKIHDNIALLCGIFRDNNQAVRIGILKALEK